MISIIIPVYNAEKYIDNCLRSVLTQGNAEFEVIIINDGSTDRTDERCQVWIESYKNIIYIKQENQGQGSARNRGINQARGTWLVFLDADDELIPGALHKLQKMTMEETDIICYEFFLRRRLEKDEDEYVCLFDGEYRWNGDLIRESTSFLWDKMFRTEFWRRKAVVLDNTYGEDFKAVYLLEALCGSFSFLREPLVYHYERENNLSSNPMKVMEITRTVEETVKEFIHRKLFDCFKVSLFYIIRRQIEIYRFPGFCTFALGQPEIIREELERILKTYFSECLDWLQVFKKTELVLIGHQCRFWYGDNSVFERISFFPELENFTIGNWESNAESQLFMVDLSQEGRCWRFGTRTDEWQKQRWKGLTGEFFHAVSKCGKLVRIFVFDRKGLHYSELYQIWIEQKGVYPIGDNVPLLEKLISEKPFLGKSMQEYSTEFEKLNKNGNFWCRGEQYRLQFNEAILNAWLMLKNRNKNFAAFFTERGYQNVAVYGMGYLGKRLLEELVACNINVIYGIDQKTIKEKEFSIYTMEELLPQADVIIVTVVHLFFDIRYELEKRTDIPVISLEEILETLLPIDGSC